MIYIITGKKNIGKTKYLKDMIKTLRKTDGFITIKQFEKKNFIGYNIERVLTGEKVPFIRFDKKSINKNNIYLEYSNMIFLKEGYNFARRIFFEAKKQEYENFIMDEIGPIELEGKLFSEMLMDAIGSFKNLYISVREDIIEEVIKKFKIKNYEKIYIERREDDRFEHKERKPYEDSKKMQGEGNNNTNIQGAEESRINKKRNKRRVKENRLMGDPSKESFQDNMEE